MSEMLLVVTYKIHAVGGSDADSVREWIEGHDHYSLLNDSSYMIVVVNSSPSEVGKEIDKLAPGGVSYMVCHASGQRAWSSLPKKAESLLQKYS